MSRILVPAVLSAILIALLVGVNRGTYAFAEFMGAGFTWGFLVGCTFCAGLYGLICWIDPASRPRGSGATADQQRPRHRID